MNKLFISYARDEDGGHIGWEGDLTKITLADLLIWWSARAANSLGYELAEQLLRVAAKDLAAGRLPGEIEAIEGEVQGNA